LSFNTSRLYEEPTGKRLAELGGFSFRRSLSRRREKYNSYEDVLIRYGVITYSAYDKRFLRVFNRAISIANNINKLKSLFILRRNGIRTVPFWTRFEDIPNNVFPILGRRISHSRGTDIRVIKRREYNPHKDFYTQLIDNWREYRCHIMFNNCVRLSMKSKKSNSEYSEGEKFHPTIRSFHRGWKVNDHFEHNIDVENEVIKLCKKALKSMGLDFGAVDIIVSTDYTPYILEVNTSPHLNKFGRQIYAKEFREFLELPNDNIELSRIRNCEFKNKIPIKYRLIYRSREERRINERGL